MATHIELQPAYLLHSRPFRDNSFLLDFITPDYGRLGAVSRGGRSAGSKSRGLLQPFIPVQISLAGKSELKTLKTIEVRQALPVLHGERLFSAMYMNELIVRLFQSHEADPGFFHEYEQALESLAARQEPEPVLRSFELSLLDTLGYGVDFTAEADTALDIDPRAWYYFQTENGFIKVQNPDAVVESQNKGHSVFRGDHLLNIHERNFQDVQTRKTAKSVLRGILNSHLGSRPLGSRSLFSRK